MVRLDELHLAFCFSKTSFAVTKSVGIATCWLRQAKRICLTR